MGIFTTVIFWTTEFAFGTRELRYLGGALGSAIDYIVKYWLDKKYEFRINAKVND